MRSFQKAIDTAYKSLIANGKYPFVVLNLEIPPADVDVNVHPTKKEVRYKNTNQIFNFIYTSIQAGLSNYVERQYPQFTQTAPQRQDNVVDFIQPKLESSGEIFFDKNDDAVYVSDKIMEQESENNVQENENTEQGQFFVPAEKEPEYEENIVGQYKKYIYFNRKKKTAWK